MEVPQRKKIWDWDIVLRRLSRPVNQKGKGILFVFYASSWTCKSKRWWSVVMRYLDFICDVWWEPPRWAARWGPWTQHPRGLLCARMERTERRRRGDSLSLSPPSNPSYSAPLQCDHVSSHNMPHAPSSNLRVNARTGRIKVLWVISRHRCQLAWFF